MLGDKTGFLAKPEFQKRRSDPAEVRTQDPQIKSLLLYQLSYGVGLYLFSNVKINRRLP